MQDQQLPAGPAPMESGGSYNERSSVQSAGAEPALELLTNAARDAALSDDSSPIVIADYGSSEGRNSLAPMAAAIDVFRNRAGASRAISVIHTDLPGNDFTALFELLQSDPGSYLKDDPAVFASAVGSSFYKQVLPTASVTLGWCAWAVQWLSRTPAVIPDQVQVAYSRDPTARAAFALQAAKDWETFLTVRGKELRPGGRLVVLTMARTDAGDFGYRPLLAALYDTLRSLVARGVVLEDEATKMAIPTVGRTRGEFTAPFADAGFAGLRLDELRMFEGEDKIWKGYLRDGNAGIYGSKWAAFSAASVLPTLVRNLAGGSEDSRAPQFLAEMEAGMADRLADAPEAMSIPLAALVLARD